MSGGAIRAILRGYPFMRPRVAVLRRLPSVPESFSPVPVRGGLKLFQCYPGDDVVSKSLFWLGEFDPWVNRALERLSRPGDTVADIGANIGATVLCLAQSVGANGRVIAFEPFPPHLEKLRANVEGNHLGQVAIQAMALSSAPGKLSMSMPDETRQGMAHVGSDGQRTREVEADTFDRVVERLAIKSVSVCKIDVEGHEPQVLAGMEKTLADGVIQAFVFEHHREPGDGGEGDSVLGLFKERGYRVFRLHKSFLSFRGVELGEKGAGEPTADHVAVLKGSEGEKRWLA
jgi:FkbM family methyltransferase